MGAYHAKSLAVVRHVLAVQKFKGVKDQPLGQTGGVVAHHLRSAT